jgi:hypothetical protein
VGSYFVRVFQDFDDLKTGHYVDSRIATLQFSFSGGNNDLFHRFAYDKFTDVIIRPLGNPNGYAEWHTMFEESVASEATISPAPVLGYTGTQNFSTVGAHSEPGELHCGTKGGASQWFAFICPSNGTLYLDTEGSTFDTILAVYTGAPPPYTNLTSMACDNDSGPGLTSSLSMNAVANTIYYIAVDGVNGATGMANLNYRLLVPIVISGFTKPNATTVRFRVTATPSYPVSIQRSGGMLTWATVFTTNVDTNTFIYRETNATPVKRYYRAVQVP